MMYKFRFYQICENNTKNSENQCNNKAYRRIKNILTDCSTTTSEIYSVKIILLALLF